MRDRFFIIIFYAFFGILMLGISAAVSVEHEQEWSLSQENDYSEYESKVLLEKESLYHYILVVEEGGIRRLRFRRSGSEYEESAININHPLQFEMYYYHLMFAGFAHKPDPKRILFVGLGGGTVSMAIHHYFPDVPIDNIELDPEVVSVAKKYFGFKEDSLMKIYVRDGRVQVRRFLRDKMKYDIIFVDTFRGGYIPYHLTTKEFMEILKALLNPGGVVVSNLRPGFESYHYHRRTFDAVFNNQYSYGSGGNVIVVVDTRQKPMTQKDLLTTARRLQKEKRFTLDLPVVVEAGEIQNGYMKKGPILTDDYAPTDVLRGIPRE
jgi:spermidine synthase